MAAALTSVLSLPSFLRKLRGEVVENFQIFQKNVSLRYVLDDDAEASFLIFLLVAALSAFSQRDNSILGTSSKNWQAYDVDFEISLARALSCRQSRRLV